KFDQCQFRPYASEQGARERHGNSITHPRSDEKMPTNRTPIREMFSNRYGNRQLAPAINMMAVHTCIRVVKPTRICENANQSEW
ncbi:MAG: hypothetical protein MPJ50_01360, partial [Pirellulales bacterium]|nr:hypothetical protein [Pirellulales bacterium]